MSLSLRELVSLAGRFLSQIIPLPSVIGKSCFFSQFHSGNVTPYEPLSGAPSCPIGGPLSCHNSTPVSDDSCCFVYPGGRMLLAQFWDRKVLADGAEEDWTLHGLWPDLCDGTYDQFCRTVPRYSNITEILSRYGHGRDGSPLIRFMNRYWLADSGPNSRLWQHEFNKHATCINTLSPRCYRRGGSSGGHQYQPGMEAVDYFARAASLFRMLDTYRALHAAGILPSAGRRYPLSDVQGALEKYSGGKVVLRCNGGSGGDGDGDGHEQGHGDGSEAKKKGHVLHEAWYVYFVQGSLQTGEFVPAKDLGDEADTGNCALWVWYLPKTRRAFWEL